MERTMFEYLVNVFARVVFGYLGGVLVAASIFAAYWYGHDFEYAKQTAIKISQGEFFKFLLCLPLVVAWFNPNKSGSAGCHNIYYGYYY